MKVLIRETGAVEELEDGFAVRLVEQGRAVLPPAPARRGKAKAEAENESLRTVPNDSSKKGRKG